MRGEGGEGRGERGEGEPRGEGSKMEEEYE